MKEHKAPFSLRYMAIACAAACLGLPPAWAEVSATGSFGTGPTAISIGPGNTIAPTTGLWIGSPYLGSLLVNDGSFLQLARLSFGAGGTGNGTGLITGANTRVELVGDGFSNSQGPRLSVGDWGIGNLTVSAGALLNSRVNLPSCLLMQHYCDQFVGGAAGDTAVLNIDGAGTEVRLGQSLLVAHPGLAVQSLNGYTYGVPGGTTRGTVNITGGALLDTERATIATNHWDNAATGRERNIGEVNVSGAGSRWIVTGGKLVDHSNGVVFDAGAFVGTASHRNALAALNVTDGGLIEIQGAYGLPGGSGMNLTDGGGRTDVLISGAGSRLAFTGDNTFLQIGRRLGSASLSVLAGGSVTGMQYVSVGRDGSFGEMLIDGANSLLSVTGIASTAATGGAVFNPDLTIGRNGTGLVNVRNGGRIEIKSTTAAGASGSNLTLGREGASHGTLNITGPGSVVQLSTQSVVAGGGANEAFNPLARIGREGSGELNITQGGQLLLDGQAISTVANARNTTLYVGGNNSTTAGGKGTALVSGAGSAIRITGVDPFIGVGWGPQSVGQLTVADQGTVESGGIIVGSVGTGVFKMNSSVVNLSGQFTGGSQSGAFMVIGDGGGIGVATMSNGAVLNVSNMGTAGAGVYLGGTGNRPFGDGSLTMTGGSSIHIQAAPGLGALWVGREGSALVRVRGASSIDVGDGDLIVARLKGSDGTLLVSENSSLTAGWVGVGRNKTATGDVDGGTGTVVLVNSTLTAQDIVVGTNGFLGGSGTIVGNVTNHGIFSPGNSPGILEIDGSFTALAGSKMILEIESNGLGGFNTDLVIFKGGQPLDLANLNAEFRFLGNTDPNAFGASGLFNIDTFFQERQGDNTLAGLAPSVFDTAVFTAQADRYQITQFSFNAATGGTITAAVPEPESWALMLTGLLTIGCIARRRMQVRLQQA
jgi:hypothetical protein